MPRLPVAVVAFACLLLCLDFAGAAPPPSAAKALGHAPIQPQVDYTIPGGKEVATCSVELENSGKSTAWVVRTKDRQVLRRFIDTNGDNLVDIWSYYQDGVEVYRDIDADFNKKADQYRWFHSGGTRWGMDQNEDGKIDRWRAISAHEAAEELVEAIRNRDQGAFDRLLITPAELKRLGLGKSLSARFREKLRAAPSEFRKLIASQKVVTSDSRFVDFGAPRPGTVPAGTDGATRDIMLYESASALLDNGGKPEQVQVGAMLSTASGWRLIEAPQVGSDGIELAGVFSLASSGGSSGVAGSAPPSEQMQSLMEELEKLDTRMVSASPQDRVKLVDSRAKLLRQLASASEDTTMREQWWSQLADMLSAAVVEGGYPQGTKALKDLAAELVRKRVSSNLMAHVQFQAIWADWGLKSQDPKQDYAKVQEAWLKQLQAFVSAHPASPDAAEALLQLGMAEEFAGRQEEAERWYQKLASDFSSTPRGRKAAGAVRRLNSIGKPISLSGAALSGGQISLSQYRGKVVLLQYWATWCEPCKADMAQIQQLYSRYSNRGFAVIGVNLDAQRSSATAYLKQNRFPWKHAYDEGGLEGQLASEMGVMTLPLMVLVDEKGRVVRKNLHVAELDAELKRLIR